MIFSISAGPDSGRRGLDRDGSVPEWLRFEAGGVQFVGDSRVLQLLCCCKLQHDRH